MRVLICLSSGRKNGNTAKIVRLFEESLKKEAAGDRTELRTETVFLAHSRIQPCLGCRTCFDHGEEKCPLKDDIRSIREKMRKADGLVAASPVYVNDVNGVMKNWIDRLAHACHRPEFAGKSSLVMATTGSTSTSATLLNMKIALWTWGYRVAGQAGFAAGALMEAAVIRRKYGKRIAALAHRFFRDLKYQRTLNPSFFSLMVFRIQQLGWKRKSPDTYDGRFWHGTGWLKPSVTYYFPHKAFFLKVFFARVIGGLLSLFNAKT